MEPQKITLRRFPFPYIAALSICSDIDNTHSVEMYLALMDYINGETETIFGKGLGLEMSNSFWFFSFDPSQLSYYENNSARETKFAPYCREMLSTGHIDVLHTYGNFDDGGFSRTYAEKAINELERIGVKMRVWVNHGNEMNRQNLGLFDLYKGAVPASTEYHNDLLSDYGIRFVWMGRMTHILGQSCSRSWNVAFKNLVQSILFNTKHRKVKNLLFDPENRLMIERELQDGNKVWDFQRWINNWGRETTTDIHDLSAQLKPANIDRLLKNEGFLIVYTHFCEGLKSPRSFPEKLKSNLGYIKQLHEDKRLLVTGTSRLLQFKEAVDNISFKTFLEEDINYIDINPVIKVVGKEIHLTEKSLEGITFYCSRPENVVLTMNGKKVSFQKNPPDQTGRPSISVPWNFLEYPRT